jgi:uncharacterized protein (DUF58 family)
MYLRPRVVAALVLAGGIASVLPANPWLVLIIAASLVVVLVILDSLLAPRPADFRPYRRAPEVLRLDRAADVMVRLHNPTARRLSVGVHDAASPSMRRSPTRHHETMDPGQWVELDARVRPSRRGRATFGPITLRTAGPLGLAGRQATLHLTDEVKVYPSLHGRAEVELRFQRARLLQAGQRSSAFRGGGSQFDSLREYRPDDEFRRINWRATARSPRPVANEYREEHNQQVVLLLDASRATAGQVKGVSRLEHALDAAIAVGDLAARVGDHVGALAFGREVMALAEPRGGRTQPRRILDLLFDLEPGLDAANYPQAFATLLRRHRRRAWLVLFTDLSEESVLEPLLRAIPVLVARHLVVVASVRDPDVEALALSVPSTSEEAYEKAAAAGFLSWREAAAGKIRRLGAVTIDSQPGALAAAVADEYLRIKALGRL